MVATKEGLYTCEDFAYDLLAELWGATYPEPHHSEGPPDRRAFLHYAAPFSWA